MLRPLLCALTALLTALWLLAAASPARAGGACERVSPVPPAQRTVSQHGRLLEQRNVGALDELAPQWRNEHTTVRYRIALDACPGLANRALWIYRVGAPYRAWLDGQPLVAIDPPAPLNPREAAVYNGRVPALFLLPPGAGVLEIELATVPYISSGLVRLVTGPQDALLDMRVRDNDALVATNNVLSAVVGAIGLLALLVWRLRPHDRMVLWFGVACAAWALRGWAYQAFVYPGPALLMEQINPWLVLSTAGAVSASVLHAVQQASPWRLRALALVWGALTAGLAAGVLAGLGSVPLRSLAFLSGFLMLCGSAALLVRRWRQDRRKGHAIMLLGLLVVIGGAVHDLGMVTGLVSPDHWSVVTPAFTVMLLTHTVAVSIYLGHSLNRAEAANEELERKIAAKSRALEQSYALLRESERASARAQERARFNREIHDGLGAQLITALRGVERGALDKTQVAQTLQDGLDELRLLMDSADLGQTLHEALVAWRNRWDPRLQALGLALHWSVEPVLDGLELGSDATLQVMRVLQEAVTNTVKHAGAASVTVRAWLDSGAPQTLVLEVRDDGCGLRARPPGRGRGLGNMRQRAERLRAQLLVDDAPAPWQGTLVRLTLPLREGDFPPSGPAPLAA